MSLKKMLTPPKSKSIWQAATAGSTKGWAKGFEGWGPALNAALGMVPGVGPALSIGGGLIGMGGKGTGFRGTDYGWSNLGSTLWGGLQGYGLGSLGAGLKGGIQGLGAGTGFLGGAKSGMGGYFGTNIIPGQTWSSGTNIGKTLLSPFTKMPTGATSTFTAGQTGANAGTYNPYTWQNILSNILGGGQGGGEGGQGFGGKELIGAGLLTASAFQKPPRLGQSEQDRQRAMSAVYAPNLVQARDLIRQMALANPSELVNPASDKYIEATLRQSRQAYDRAKQDTINTYSARGKVVGKSGAVDERLARMEQEQLQGETDFITRANESRYLAGIQLKVQAVSNYFQVSQQEALQLLSSYGYINNIDMQNYLGEMQAFNNLQQIAGTVGGNLMIGNRTSLFGQ